MKKLLLIASLFLLPSIPTQCAFEHDVDQKEQAAQQHRYSEMFAEHDFTAQVAYATGLSQEKVKQFLSPQNQAPAFRLSYEDMPSLAQQRFVCMSEGVREGIFSRKNLLENVDKIPDYQRFKSLKEFFSTIPEDESSYWKLWFDYAKEHNQAPTTEIDHLLIKRVIERRTSATAYPKKQHEERAMNPPKAANVNTHAAAQNILDFEAEEKYQNDQEQQDANWAKQERNYKLRSTLIDWDLKLKTIEIHLSAQKRLDLHYTSRNNHFTLPDYADLNANIIQWSHYFMLYRNMTKEQCASYFDLASTYNAQYPTVLHHTCMLKYACLTPEQQQEYDRLSLHGPANSPEFYIALADTIPATPEQRQQIDQWQADFRAQHACNPTHKQLVTHINFIKGHPIAKEIERNRKEREEWQAIRETKLQRAQNAQKRNRQHQEAQAEFDGQWQKINAGIEARKQAQQEAMPEKERNLYYDDISALELGIAATIIIGATGLVTYGTYKCTSLLYRKSVACYNAATNYIKQKIAKAKSARDKKTTATS